VVATALYGIPYQAAEEERRAYAWLRVQIGGLLSGPPAKPAEDLNAVDIRRTISTGVPGAQPIRLDSLVDRGLRIQKLQRRRSEAMSRLDDLQPHPWLGNQDKTA
jgi:hypothetical protein